MQEEYKPPLKLKLSRKESSRETPCFEINKPIISSLLRPGWVELQKLARQQAAGLTCSPPPSNQSRLSFSPPPLLTSPREVVVRGQVARAYSPISSPDLSTHSSPPPPPVLLSPQGAQQATNAAGSELHRSLSPARKERHRKQAVAAVGAIQEDLPPTTDMDIVPPPAGGEPDVAAAATERGGRGRGRRLLACPLCGAEYALATTLEKHIDRDHREETPATGRRAKRPSRSTDRSPPKKRRTATPTAPPDAAASSTSAGNNNTSAAAGEADRPKLTEYEIFQSLQLPADRKMVACEVCGQLVPPNTLKRHLAR